jgi:hypothetical protein
MPGRQRGRGRRRTGGVEDIVVIATVVSAVDAVLAMRFAADAVRLPGGDVSLREEYRRGVGTRAPKLSTALDRWSLRMCAGWAPRPLPRRMLTRYAAEAARFGSKSSWTSASASKDKSLPVL